VALLLAAAATLAIAAPALAAPPGPDALPVAVVAVKSDEALDQAEALTQALRKAIRDSDGWSLGEATQALEFLVVKMKCDEPIDAACEARIAEVIKADRYIWCVINFEEGDETTVTGELNFFVRGKGTNKVPIRYSANLTDPNDDSLMELANKWIDEATGGAPKGSLKITTGGVAGQLFMDDAPVGALSAEGGTFKLPAGRHRIVVKAPGYADAETTVVVRPATTVEANLTLVETEEGEGADVRMIGGFAAVAVGAGLGGVGLWQSLEVNEVRGDPRMANYRSRLTQSINACEHAETATTPPILPGNVAPQDAPDGYDSTSDPDPGEVRDLCKRAKKGEIIQAVVFPLAAVSAGVGLYLLGTSSLFGSDSEGDELEALTVEPLVGPEGGAITVTYRF
jgi:hypothetical protein